MDIRDEDMICAAGSSFNGKPIDKIDVIDQEIIDKLKEADLFGKPFFWKVNSSFYPWNGHGRVDDIKHYYETRGELPSRISMPDKPSAFFIESKSYEWNPKNQKLSDEVRVFILREGHIPSNRELATARRKKSKRRKEK
jgi:hypothetical protein